MKKIDEINSWVEDRRKKLNFKMQLLRLVFLFKNIFGIKHDKRILITYYVPNEDREEHVCLPVNENVIVNEHIAKLVDVHVLNNGYELTGIYFWNEVKYRYDSINDL